MWKQAAVLTICGAMLACSTGKAPEAGIRQEDEVTVERDTALGEIRYSMAKGGCRITWTAHTTEINRNVIRHRAECELPLAEQVPLLAKLLRRVMESGTDPSQFQTLSWGRIYPDGPQDSTLAVRLALAAKNSEEWDAARGVSRGGDVNGFVRKLANDQLIYPELRALFREYGLDIELASVEKVLVLPAGRLPFFDRLQKGGAQAGDKLPFDCQAWFSIRGADQQRFRRRAAAQYKRTP
jgi:hypothetical protein